MLLFRHERWTKKKNSARDERVCKSLSLSNWRTGITEMFLIEIIRANIIIIIFFKVI